MNEKLILALEDCLQSLQKGASLEATLARYPDLSDELRPLLHTAQAAQSVDPEPIPQKAFVNGRSHLLAQVNDLRRKQESRRGLSPVLRYALIAGFVLVLLVASGGGLLSASANALPDDPLYGVKRTAETIQLGLTFDPAQKDVLEDKFYQRRIAETESLLTDQRTVEIKFGGLVESQLTDGWLISGLRVVVTHQTEVNGDIVLGVQVEVEGLTQTNGTVLAQKISLGSDGNGGNGSGSNSSGSGETRATETPKAENTESRETPQVDGGSTNPGSGSNNEGGGSGSSTQDSNSGSNGSGDITKTPEPTRTVEPTKTPEPSKTEAPTKTPEPTKTEEPTRTAEPTK